MANSLQDALRGAGLVAPEKEKRARRKRQRRRDTEARRRSPPEADPQAVDASPAPAAAPALSSVQARSLRSRSQAIARDPWLSGTLKARARREEKERALLERARSARLDDPEATRPFHFTRGRRIKRILVTEAQHRALLAGEIVVVGLKGEHLLLPNALAMELKEERPDTFVHRVTDDAAEADADDSAHAVPDDLVW